MFHLISFMIYFDAGSWIDLVHGIARRATRLAIQIIALYEHRIIAETAQPDIALSAQIQLHALAYV